MVPDHSAYLALAGSVFPALFLRPGHRNATIAIITAQIVVIFHVHFLRVNYTGACPVRSIKPTSGCKSYYGKSDASELKNS